MSRIVGIPRKMSTYAIASARMGKNTGPGRERSTATKSASGRMIASAIAKILTFSRNAFAISGKSALNRCPLKKAWWTCGQPGAFTIANASATNTIAVETSAIITPRRPSVAPVRPRRIFEPRSDSAGLLEDRDGDDLRQPARVDLLQRAVALQL